MFCFLLLQDINNLCYSHITYICSLFKTEQKHYPIQTPFTDYTCSVCSLEEVHFQAFAQLPSMKSTIQVMKRNCSIDFCACKQALFRAVWPLPVFLYRYLGLFCIEITCVRILTCWVMLCKLYTCPPQPGS